MVDLRAPLTPRQLEILRWVAAGCADGVMEGHGHKILATALDSRGMITISKKGGDWRASLTDRGRYYLDHDAYPPAEPASAEPAQRSTTARAIEQLDSASTVGEKLIAKLVAAGGVITIDTRADTTNYREQIDAARRWKKIPPGQQLIYERAEGTAWHVYELRLEAVPAWWTAELVPIPVPDQLRGAHPVVTALRDSDAIRSIKGPARQRALLLIQALAAEAARRGYEVTVAPPADRHYRRQDDDDFTIDPGGHAVGIHVKQHIDRVKHVPTPAELKRQEKHPWERPPTHDAIPTDRLGIHVSGPHAHRQSNWNDGRTRLEDKLPQVLQEVELRAAAAEQARLKREEAAREKRRKWEAAMTQAKIDLREASRAAALDHQLAAWQHAEQLRAYLEAMRQRVDAMGPTEAAMAAEWMEWAKQHTDRLDPLGGRLAMPADPEPKPEALKPFLKGRSPHGPDERWY